MIEKLIRIAMVGTPQAQVPDVVVGTRGGLMMVLN